MLKETNWNHPFIQEYYNPANPSYTMLYNAIQCYTMLYNAMQCYAMLYIYCIYIYYVYIYVYYVCIYIYVYTVQYYAYIHWYILLDYTDDLYLVY